jgi:hypothetical protein
MGRGAPTARRPLLAWAYLTKRRAPPAQRRTSPTKRYAKASYAIRTAPLSRVAPAATETGAPRPCVTGMGGLTGVPKEKMKMKMILTTVFGGILAAGFLTAPPAHADPCADAMYASIRAGTPANIADQQFLACHGINGPVVNPPANFPDCQRLATPVEQAQCGDKHIAGQPYP